MNLKSCMGGDGMATGNLALETQKNTSLPPNWITSPPGTCSSNKQPSLKTLAGNQLNEINLLNF